MSSYFLAVALVLSSLGFYPVLLGDSKIDSSNAVTYSSQSHSALFYTDEDGHTCIDCGYYPQSLINPEDYFNNFDELTPVNCAGFNIDSSGWGFGSESVFGPTQYWEEEYEDIPIESIEFAMDDIGIMYARVRGDIQVGWDNGTVNVSYPSIGYDYSFTNNPTHESSGSAGDEIYFICEPITWMLAYEDYSNGVGVFVSKYTLRSDVIGAYAARVGSTFEIYQGIACGGVGGTGTGPGDFENETGFIHNYMCETLDGNYFEVISNDELNYFNNQSDFCGVLNRWQVERGAVYSGGEVGIIGFNNQPLDPVDEYDHDSYDMAASPCLIRPMMNINMRLDPSHWYYFEPMTEHNEGDGDFAFSDVYTSRPVFLYGYYPQFTYGNAGETKDMLVEWIPVDYLDFFRHYGQSYDTLHLVMKNILDEDTEYFFDNANGFLELIYGENYGYDDTPYDSWFRPNDSGSYLSYPTAHDYEWRGGMDRVAERMLSPKMKFEFGGLSGSLGESDESGEVLQEGDCIHYAADVDAYLISQSNMYLFFGPYSFAGAPIEQIPGSGGGGDGPGGGGGGTGGGGGETPPKIPESFAKFLDYNRSTYPTTDISYTVEGANTIFHIKKFNGLMAMSAYAKLGDGLDEELSSGISTTYCEGIFYLDNDIDCAGKSFEGILRLRGTFDGQGYCIYNLTPGYKWTENVYYGDNYYASFFIGHMDRNSTLKNINFINAHFDAMGYAGLIWRAQLPCTLENVYLEASIDSDDDAYGFVGISSNLGDVDGGLLTIKGCGLFCTKFEGLKTPVFTEVQNAEVIDSFAYGTLKFMEGSVFPFDGYKLFKEQKYSGVYIYDTVANKKVYASGFTDSLWLCDDSLHSGYPTLKWNLWVGDKYDSSPSVENFLKAKGFTIPTT